MVMEDWPIILLAILNILMFIYLYWIKISQQDLIEEIHEETKRSLALVENNHGKMISKSNQLILGQAQHSVQLIEEQTTLSLQNLDLNGTRLRTVLTETNKELEQQAQFIQKYGVILNQKDEKIGMLTRKLEISERKMRKIKNDH